MHVSKLASITCISGFTFEFEFRSACFKTLRICVDKKETINNIARSPCPSLSHILGHQIKSKPFTRSSLYLQTKTVTGHVRRRLTSICMIVCTPLSSHGIGQFPPSLINGPPRVVGHLFDSNHKLMSFV